MAKSTISLAAISGLVAVTLGAFGAHGLENTLSERMMEVWQTAVQYQFYHSLALLLVATIMLQVQPSRLLNAAAILFLLGIIIFSGSLYILALSGITWLGAITPIGGTLFMIGWIVLAIAAFKISK